LAIVLSVQLQCTPFWYLSILKLFFLIVNILFLLIFNIYLLYYNVLLSSQMYMYKENKFHQCLWYMFHHFHMVSRSHNQLLKKNMNWLNSFIRLMWKALLWQYEVLLWQCEATVYFNPFIMTKNTPNCRIKERIGSVDVYRSRLPCHDLLFFGLI
jgi:hypothetical protein